MNYFTTPLQVTDTVAIGSGAVAQESNDIHLTTGKPETEIYLSHASGTIMIGGIDFKTIVATVCKLEAQVAHLKALEPLATYARDQAARKIQRAWRNYWCAPGTGKLYRTAEAHWNEHI